MKIIINADDFGLDASRNAAVSEAFKKGLCSQTSIIINMPDSKAAVIMSKEQGFFDKVCLHLNLTVGTPLTKKIRQYPEFCTGEMFNGRFHHNIVQRFTKKHSNAVMDELEAQILLFLEFGFPMRHADSHHWIHLDRKVACVAIELLLKYGFKSIRKGENIKPILDRDIIKQKKTYLHLSSYIACYNRLIKRKGIITADYVGKIHNIGKYSSNIWESPVQDKVVEFITHPFYNNGILYDKGVGPLVELINPLRESGHEFITYKDLL